MRILFLTHSFNSLCQRLFVELTEAGHEVSVEFDINDAVTMEAVAMFRPELIIAPYLKRAIPEAIWRRHTCLVVHPGIKGDRGPSALDWAIMNGEREWGVTVLQAAREMDGGDIWAEETFPLRLARKSSIYRNGVTEAAVKAVRAAVERFAGGNFRPQPLDYSRQEVNGKPRPLMRQADRAIDWQRDNTATVLKKIHAADGFPGVLDNALGIPCFLYNAHAAAGLCGTPGEVIARCDGAICRATVDGAIWITHLRREQGEPSFKLPAALVLGKHLASVPEIAPQHDESPARREIRYEEKNGVGYLHFDFHNGAMDTEQCNRLKDAWLHASRQNARVIVLMGGTDFWCNGIHLNMIEAAPSPADESWRNINAMNDLTQAVISSDDKLTISAMQGNAGAGGVFLALAADRVFAREGIVLNPHYKGMGNLYGSEYWTYLLPRRMGEDRARKLTESRLPLGARAASGIGLIDGCFGINVEDFRRQIERIAEELAASPDYSTLLAEKKERRQRDEQTKPLAGYRAEELAQMQLNFYGFDPSYHVARYNFVHRVPNSHTPRHLAKHRLPGAIRTFL